MRATTFSVLATLGALALAQDLAGLPTCAQTAALNGATGSGCSLTDAQCLCTNTGFITSLRGAIASSCTSVADQQAACAWGNSACSQYGVTIPCGTTETPAASDVAAPPADTGASTPVAVDAGVAAPVTTTPSMDGIAASTTPVTSISMPADGSMDTMTSGSMMSSVSTIPAASMSSLMNSTHSMMGNMTHSPTSTPPTSTTGSVTAKYTGAGNSATRQSGIFGVVVGVALLFAFI
ncbi:hypothetical protein LTR05_005549 [Lithohypha guttulata]|uniref:CFEM domain-containing protein n=1 Tax=Lithohypha guttulata TaxID=1690604 RepID=A0AAN7SZH5_9EURO|nr:hypothetical protein LTR05_005549 [Lithohypha guttulata]